MTTRSVDNPNDRNGIDANTTRGTRGTTVITATALIVRIALTAIRVLPQRAVALALPVLFLDLATEKAGMHLVTRTLGVVTVTTTHLVDLERTNPHLPDDDLEMNYRHHEGNGTVGTIEDLIGTMTGDPLVTTLDDRTMTNHPDDPTGTATADDRTTIVHETPTGRVNRTV